MRTKVFIAAPYTLPDPDVNTRRAIRAAHSLLDRGYAFHLPILCHYAQLQRHRSYENWMEHNMEWLPTCHCVLRLPGKSPGADKEVAKAIELGIPVYQSIVDLAEQEPVERKK